MDPRKRVGIRYALRRVTRRMIGWLASGWTAAVVPLLLLLGWLVVSVLAGPPDWQSSVPTAAALAAMLAMLLVQYRRRKELRALAAMLGGLERLVRRTASAGPAPLRAAQLSPCGRLLRTPPGQN